MVPVKLFAHPPTDETFLQTPLPGGAFSREFLAPALRRPQKSFTGTVALCCLSPPARGPPPSPPPPTLCCMAVPVKLFNGPMVPVKLFSLFRPQGAVPVKLFRALPDGETFSHGGTGETFSRTNGTGETF